jgi:hypothetical protein
MQAPTAPLGKLSVLEPKEERLNLAVPAVIVLLIVFELLVFRDWFQDKRSWVRTLTGIFLFDSTHVVLTFFLPWAFPEVGRWVNSRPRFFAKAAVLFSLFLPFWFFGSEFGKKISGESFNFVWVVVISFLNMQHVLMQSYGFSSTYNALARRQLHPSEFASQFRHERREKAAFWLLVLLKIVSDVSLISSSFLGGYPSVPSRLLLSLCIALTVGFILWNARSTPGSSLSNKRVYLLRLVPLVLAPFSIIASATFAFVHGIEYMLLLKKFLRRSESGSPAIRGSKLPLACFAAAALVFASMLIPFFPSAVGAKLLGSSPIEFPIWLQILVSCLASLTAIHYWMDYQIFRFREKECRETVGKLMLGSFLLLAFLPEARAADLEAFPRQEKERVVGIRLAASDFTDPAVFAEIQSRMVGKSGLLLLQRDLDCPLGKKLSPELKELESSQADRFAVVLANFRFNESSERILKENRAQGLKSFTFLDKRQTLARRLGVYTTTEVFLFDRDLKLVYRGAVNDRLSITSQRAEAKNEFLRKALAELVAGKQVSVPVTSAPGCLLDYERTEAASSGPKFAAVEGIFARKCANCHYQGGSSFSLSSYADIIGHLKMIEYTVERDLMPPWAADAGTGPWKDRLSLDAEEKALLLSWIKSGGAGGGVKSVKAPRKSEWQIGKPDFILRLPEAVHIPAKGVIPYKYTYIPTPFSEDKWIRASEIKVQQKTVAHHLQIRVLNRMPKPGENPYALFTGALGGYTQGQKPIELPEDTGMLLPKGAIICVISHYEVDGTERWDRPSIGFIFNKKAPANEFRHFAIDNKSIDIRPGERIEVGAEIVLPQDIRLMFLFPHMHLRGKVMSLSASSKGGGSEVLFRASNFRFKHQNHYEFSEPRLLQKGTLLRLSGVFDNSSENRENPDSTSRVRYGIHTYLNEMLYMGLGYSTPVKSP